MSHPSDLLSVRDAVVACTAEVLGRPLPPGNETAERDFASLGVDSVTVFHVQIKLETKYDLELSEVFLFEHPTPQAAAEKLVQLLGHHGTGASLR